MKSFFEKLLRKRPAKPVLRMVDRDFGPIEYVPAAINRHGGYWQMEDEWSVPYQAQKISSPSIPGDESGPSEAARQFILSKRADPESLWGMCESAIQTLMDGWPQFNGAKPRDAFHIASIAMDTEIGDPQGWEVCFETNDNFKWIYFCLQMKGNEWETNTIDT